MHIWNMYAYDHIVCICTVSICVLVYICAHRIHSKYIQKHAHNTLVIDSMHWFVGEPQQDQDFLQIFRSSLEPISKNRTEQQNSNNAN